MGVAICRKPSPKPLCDGPRRVEFATAASATLGPHPKQFGNDGKFNTTSFEFCATDSNAHQAIGRHLEVGTKLDITKWRASNRRESEFRSRESGIAMECSRSQDGASSPLPLRLGSAMNAQKMDLNSGLAGSAGTRDAGDFVLRTLGLVIRPARLLLHFILEVLRPFVLLGLLIVGVGGYVMCGFVYLVVQHSHFPMTFTLVLSTGCLLGMVAYHTVMHLLNPDSA